jgi:SAM-dependent methyltransferase
MDITDFIEKKLTLSDGIFYADKKKQLSYPKDGHALVYQIENSSFWFKHRIECIAQTLANFKPSGTLLDVGGGNGFTTILLQELGYQIILIEPGEPGVRNAKERGVNTVVCSTLESIHFPDKSVPAIALFDVLEHQKDAADFLGYIHSKLIKGGFLYLTVPAYETLWSYEDDNAGHYRRYKKKDIMKTLNLAGFKVEYATYFFSFLFFPVFLFRSLPTRFHRRKNLNLKDLQKDHLGIKSVLLAPFMKGESNLIRGKKTIPFGSSIILVGCSK